MKNRLTGSHLMNAVIIAVIITLPLMYAGLFTWAYEKPMDRLRDIDAVVVNADRPADATLANGKELHLNLGADLTRQLYKKDAPGFHWIPASSAAEARRGLNNGTYQVALWIPRDLSSNMAQLSELKEVQPATLRLETNDGINYLTGTMAKSVALNLENIAARQGAGKFADNLLLSLDDVHKGMARADKGAQALAQGNASLAQGSQKLEGGTHRLTASVKEFAYGSAALDRAMRTYASGVEQTAQGAHKLNSGVKRFGGALSSLAGGVSTIDSQMNVSGPGTMSDGLGKLMAATTAGTDPKNPTLYDGAQRIEEGSKKISEGAKSLDEGAQKLSAGIDTLHQGAQAVNAKLPQMAAGVDNLRAQTQSGVAGGKPTVRDGVNGLHSALNPNDPRSLGGGADGLADFAQGVAGACQTPALKSDPVCTTIAGQLRAKGMSFSSLAEQAKAVKGGVTKAYGAAGATEQGLQDMYTKSAPLAQTLRPSTDPKNPTAADFIAKTFAETGRSNNPASPTLADGAAQIGAGSKALSQAADQLAGGASAEREATVTLHKGIGKVQSGYATAAGAVHQASGATAQLNAASKPLVAGSGDLAEATERLESASPKLTGATHRLSHGASQLSRGASQLNDGAATLKKGEDDAATGAQTLQTKLSQGTSQVPQLGNTQSKAVATSASKSIKVDAVRANAVAENGVGFAPFFMCLAMWVGGIAMFLLFPALDKRRNPGEKFYMCALRSFRLTAPFAILQALFVVAGLQLMLNLQARDLGLLISVCVMTSLCFVILNQGFMSLMGYRGRFASVLMLLLQITSAGATFPIETVPHFFQVIHPLLPMTYCAEAIRDYIAGGALPVFHGFAIVLLWTLIGVAMILIGAWKHPGVRPMKFDPAFAFPGRSHADAPA